MTRYRGFFDNWKFSTYTATSPDNRYCLWMANGFSCFEDYNGHEHEHLVDGLPLWTQWRLWRELKRARRYHVKTRAEANLAYEEARRGFGDIDKDLQWLRDKRKEHSR